VPGGCFLLMCLLPTAETVALSDEQLLVEATTAFHAALDHRGDRTRAQASFLQAANIYEELHRRGADNAELHRIRGNAFLLAGDLPRAILAYRQGLRLAPSDSDLQEGLAFARSLVVYPPGSTLGRPPVEQRPPWLPRLATTWYVAIVFCSYTLGCLAAARWWMTRQGRLLALSCTGFAVALLSLASMAAEEWRDADFVNRPVVVIADDGVLLRTGNGLRYPPRAETPLNRGVEARLLFVRGEWYQVELAGGEVGWVPREYALVGQPQSD